MIADMLRLRTYWLAVAMGWSLIVLMVAGTWATWRLLNPPERPPVPVVIPTPQPVPSPP